MKNIKNLRQWGMSYLRRVFCCLLVCCFTVGTLPGEVWGTVRVVRGGVSKVPARSLHAPNIGLLPEFKNLLTGSPELGLAQLLVTASIQTEQPELLKARETARIVLDLVTHPEQLDEFEGEVEEDLLAQIAAIPDVIPQVQTQARSQGLEPLIDGLIQGIERVLTPQIRQMEVGKKLSKLNALYGEFSTSEEPAEVSAVHVLADEAIAARGAPGLTVLARQHAFANQVDETPGMNEHAPSYDYSIYHSPGSRNFDVLYFFHGGGGSADLWETGGMGEKFNNFWQELGLDAPYVVSISFGKFFLLGEPPVPQQSSDGFKMPHPLRNFLAKKIFPPNPLVPSSMVMEALQKIELKLPEFSGKRHAFGASMGSFNAASLALKHPEKFDRVALVAFLTYGNLMRLYQPRFYRWLWGTVKKSNHPNMRAKLLHIAHLLLFFGIGFKALFPTNDAFTSVNPLSLLENLEVIEGDRVPQFFVSTGNRDEYGSFSANQAFVERAQQLGLEITWRPREGGHDSDFPYGEIAEFLARPE